MSLKPRFITSDMAFPCRVDPVLPLREGEEFCPVRGKLFSQLRMFRHLLRKHLLERCLGNVLLVGDPVVDPEITGRTLNPFCSSNSSGFSLMRMGFTAGPVMDGQTDAPTHEH